MAMLFMSGCEYGISEFESGGVVKSSPYNGLAARTGSYFYGVSNQTVSKQLPGTYQELYIQAAWAFQNYWGDGDVLRWWAQGGAVTLGRLHLKGATRLFELYIGNPGTLVGTGALIPINNTWYVLEVHVLIADSGGIVEVRADGNPLISFVGDTKPGADTAIDRIGTYCGPGSVYAYDDFIVNDPSGSVNNSWPGGLKIALRKPIAEGSPQQWTPTPGPTHYTVLDELPPSGADYVKTDVADNVEKVQLSALPAEAQSVRAVQLDYWALKLSTVAPIRLAPMVELDGVDYVQADKDLPLAQGQVKELLNTNPATGGNWSVAAANALILGAKARP